MITANSDMIGSQREVRHNHRGRVLTIVSRSDKSVRRTPELLPAIAPMVAPLGTVSSTLASSIYNTAHTEKDVEKLRARLAEAERSITNYRTLLNPSRGGAVMSNAATQTVAQLGGLPLQQSVGSNDDLDKRIEKLEKINVQLSRKIEELNGTIKEANSTVQAVTIENKMLIGQLEKNAESSQQRNEQAACVDRAGLERSLLRGTAVDMGGDVDSLRADLSNLRSIVSDGFNDFNAIFDTVKVAVTSVRFKQQPPLQIPQGCDCASSPTQGGFLSAATSPINWHSIDINKEQLIIDENCEEACNNKLTFASRGINEVEAIDVGEVCAGDLTSSQAAKATPAELIMTSDCIWRVKNFIEALSKAHRLEKNAVKHTAHCKDLSRLAAQRELALERDRTQVELKYAKEIEDMLNFSLNAIERIVNETQPSVVQKLSESRAKKLKQIQMSLIARSRELDQRSTEIGAMNSVHLQTFQTKAQNSQKLREEETASLLKLFVAELDQWADDNVGCSKLNSK